MSGKRTYAPDPKPTSKPRKQTRTVDRKATTRQTLKRRACFCGGQIDGCDGVAATSHHVLSKAQGGDDVEANLVSCSGSGTTGCHGLIENEDLDARRLLGEHLVLERPDTLDYIRRELGEVAGNDWLRRRLFIL
jgi:hypothetical protein